MTYSIIGILAAVILLISNRDVLRARGEQEMTVIERNYRLFLMGVFAYLITDMLWGILYSNHLIQLVYADTVIHFIAMATAVMLWSRYVVSYLNDSNIFGKVLDAAGKLFVAFEVIAVAVNIF